MKVLHGLIAGLIVVSTAEASAEKKKPVRTVKLDPKKAEIGKEVFKQCATCHGVEGEGRVGIAPRLMSKSYLAAAGDDLLLATITAGRTGTTMISWADRLTAQEIEAVVAYLRTKTKTEPVALDESPLKGDPERGKQVFEICQTCHGRNGGGYMESVSGTGIGRKSFLDAVSNGFLRYIIRNGKDGTQMKSFAKKSATAVANLKDQEIEDVIAYLRVTAW